MQDAQRVQASELFYPGDQQLIADLKRRPGRIGVGRGEDIRAGDTRLEGVPPDGDMKEDVDAPDIALAKEED